VIPEFEIQRLRKEGFIPQEEDIFTPEARGWVQLIPLNKVDNPESFFNRQVIVEGLLGTLIVHVHTPITIEAVGIYDNE
jgi:hypothetical protein